jgi:hypothetical protein
MKSFFGKIMKRLDDDNKCTQRKDCIARNLQGYCEFMRNSLVVYAFNNGPESVPKTVLSCQDPIIKKKVAALRSELPNYFS